MADMSKLKELLAKTNPEFAEEICTTLESWASTKKTELEEDYTARLSKAKKVCLEEVNSYKAELSRKVQIFLEARARKIEEQIAKQVAIKESDAETKLKTITAVVEGIEVDGTSAEELETIKHEVRNLKKQLITVTESRKNAVLKANRANSIAERVLQKNKELKALVESKDSAKVQEEAKTEATADGDKQKQKPLTESEAGANKKAVKKVVKKTGTQAKTTRPTLKESLVKPKTAKQATGSGFTPGFIASQMDE